MEATSDNDLTDTIKGRKKLRFSLLVEPVLLEPRMVCFYFVKHPLGGIDFVDPQPGFSKAETCHGVI